MFSLTYVFSSRKLSGSVGRRPLNLGCWYAPFCIYDSKCEWLYLKIKMVSSCLGSLLISWFHVLLLADYQMPMSNECVTVPLEWYQKFSFYIHNSEGALIWKGNLTTLWSISFRQCKCWMTTTKLDSLLMYNDLEYPITLAMGNSKSFQQHVMMCIQLPKTNKCDVHPQDIPKYT